MTKDNDWLLPYSEFLLNKRILELGAGKGRDTGKLLDQAKKLYVIEKDEDRAEIIRQKFPTAKLWCADYRQILRGFEYKIDTVISSLSLHYFTEKDTKEILNHLHGILDENSTLIVRVNSAKDVNFGSHGYPKIEEDLFEVNGKLKRFFNREAIEYFFSPTWEILNLREKSIDRFSKEKIIWEFVAKKK